MSSKVEKKVITTDKAAIPRCPVSQAIIVDNTMYIRGILGVDQETDDFVPGGTIPQAEMMFQNFGATLEAAGIGFNNIVKTTVFLTNINEWSAFNEVYTKYFKGTLPARSAFQVVALARGGRVEMEAVAILGEITDA